MPESDSDLHGNLILVTRGVLRHQIRGNSERVTEQLDALTVAELRILIEASAAVTSAAVKMCVAKRITKRRSQRP